MTTRPLFQRAWPYGAWCAFLAAAEIATYRIDPYVYGFTVMWLGAATALVLLGGILSCALAAKPRPFAPVAWSLASTAASVVGFWFLLLVSWRC